MKLARLLQTPFLPRPLRPGPLPHQPLPLLTHPRRSNPGGSPAPSSAFCPRAGARRSSPTTALGMLRGARGAAAPPAATGGETAGSRLQLSSSARSWSCREFPQPLLLARGSRSRRGRRERRPASTRAGRARPSPEPGTGHVPGEEPVAGTRAAHWHCLGTNRAAR